MTGDESPQAAAAATTAVVPAAPSKAPSYQLTEGALLTVLLHAAKWPSCTVCGVLLGQPAAAAGGKTRVTHVLPLFHLSMLLAPCVDMALTQAEVYAQQQGLKLLGYYHAEARMDASGAASMHPVGRRIAERIAERQPGGFVLLLDNARLVAFSRQGSAEPPFELLLRDGAAKGGWRNAPVVAAAAASGGGGLAVADGGSWEGLRACFLNATSKGLHSSVADFDEHLDDVSRDYTNPQLADADGLLTR